MVKRFWIVVMACMLLFCASMFVSCKKEEEITFTGTIEQVGDTNMVVYTTEIPGTDRFSLSFKDLNLSFEPVVGLQVVVTIKPEIGESYPARADVIQITQVEEETDMEQISQDHKISAQQAYQMMQQEEVLILDVRREDEYAQGHIENALLIPLAELVNQAPDKIPDKNTKILVYCRSGNRSAKAALQLEGLGYENVYDFGGINAWPYEIVQ